MSKGRVLTEHIFLPFQAGFQAPEKVFVKSL